MKYIILEKSNDFFQLGNLVSSKWNELLKESMKNFEIYFDLENNDSVGEQKTITIPQKQWDFTKCTFKCELCRAGGDWQVPVYYFRCQLVDGYAFGIQRYNSNSGMFIFIPGKKYGNYHLISKEGSKWYAPDNSIYKDGIDPEPDKKKCWQSLHDYLTSLVQKEIEKTNMEYVVKSFRMARSNKLGEDEKKQRKEEWKEEGEPQRIQRIKRYAKRRKEEMNPIIKSDSLAYGGGSSTPNKASASVSFKAGKGVLQRTKKAHFPHATMSTDYKKRMSKRRRIEAKEENSLPPDVPKEQESI